MFNATNFIIDRVRRVTECNINTNVVNWTMTNIEDPSVEFTGESRDKTDAVGVLLARFDNAKGVNFSGSGSVLSLGLMAAQLGTDVEVADTGKAVAGKTFEVLSVVVGEAGAKTATMTHTPKVAPAYVYTMSSDKNISDNIAVGAEDGNASVAGKVITLPANYEGTMVGVMYEFESTSAVKVVDGSENFTEAACYIVDILAADVCNPASKRAGSLVFPKAKLDNNFSLNLTTEGTHPFSFTALKEYCADDAELCYILFTE